METCCCWYDQGRGLVAINPGTHQHPRLSEIPVHPPITHPRFLIHTAPTHQPTHAKSAKNTVPIATPTITPTLDPPYTQLHPRCTRGEFQCAPENVCKNCMGSRNVCRFVCDPDYRVFVGLQYPRSTLVIADQLELLIHVYQVPLIHVLVVVPVVR